MDSLFSFWLPLAHPFSPHTGSWFIVEWPITIGVIVALAAYSYAMGPLRQRLAPGEPARPGQIVCFVLAMLIAFGSLQGPLHELSDYYSLSMHMVQHLLVTMIMPPLLLKGLPAWLIDPMLSLRFVQPIARFLTSPFIALASFNVIFALWHVPAFYQRALGDPAVHSMEHVLFIGSAILTWWPVFSLSQILPRMSEPVQMLYLFIQSIVPTILGALITFSTFVWYEFYAAAPRVIGLSAIDDQQVAGLLMWLGGASIVLFVLTIRFFQWMERDSDESMEASHA